jgi:hypothetical protein
MRIKEVKKKRHLHELTGALREHRARFCLKEKFGLPSGLIGRR